MSLGRLFPALFLLLLLAPRVDADWPPGGKVVSPIPAPGYSYSATDVLADGTAGVTLTWLSTLWHPFDNYDSYTLSAQHFTVFGEIASGWPVTGISLASWDPFNGPIWSAQPLRLLPDAAGGAYQPAVTRIIYLGEDVALLALTRMRADGSVEFLGSDSPFGVVRATAVAADADGSGGIVFVANQWTYTPPGNPTPPAHLYVERADATGTLLWPEITVLVPSGQQHPEWGLAAASDGSGGAFVAWVDGRDATGGPGGTLDLDLYVQHVLSDGSIAPGWPEGGVGVCTAVGRQEAPKLAHAGGGVVFVGWRDHRGPEPQIHVACLDGTGALASGCPVDGRPLGDPNVEVHLFDLLADGAGGALAMRGDRPALPSSARTYCHRIMTDALPSPGWPLAGRALGAGTAPYPVGAMCGDYLGGMYALYWDGPGPSSPAGVYATHLAANGCSR